MKFSLLQSMVWSCIGMLVCVSTAFSQPLSQYEYWFDNLTDSRVTKNISVNATEVNIADSVNISSLKDGLHTVSFRFKTPERWSAVNSNFFYKFASNGQNITSYEYWFDEKTDARITKSVSNPSDVIVLDSVNIVSLSTGLHRFYIRFTGRNGWSSVAAYLFYKLPSNVNQAISNYEYWFDDDTNNRTLKSVSGDVANGILIDSVNTTTLKTGIHRFHIRFTGQRGWSSVSTSLFYKFEGTESDIVGIEYWLNQNTQNRTFKKLTLKNDGVVLDSIDMSDLCRAKHTLSYRFKTLSGWSSVKVDTFFKSEPGENQAVADFDYVVEGNLVAFQNKALNAQQVVWRFGNGATSNLLNPFYTYEQSGVYNICQIANNNLGCPNDTLCKAVNIRGIRSITPNKSGKNSNVTVRILGGGFQPGIKVTFTRSGYSDLIPQYTFLENSGSIRSTFEFRNAATGPWTVRLDLPNGDSLTLKDGFEILDSADVKLWVKISGDRIYRPGFQANYTINYGNEGNEDAEGVFLFLNGLPKDAKVTIIGASINVRNVPGLDTITTWVESVPNEFVDPANFDTYTGILLPNIPAGSVGTVNAKIIVPVDVDLRRRFEIQASLTAPSLKDSGWECVEAIGELAEDELKIMLEEVGGDVTECWSKMVLLPYEVSKTINEYDKSGKDGYDKIVLIKDYAGSITSAFSSCVKAGFFIVLPESKLLLATLKVIDILNAVNDGYNAAERYLKIGTKCGKFGAIAIDKLISGTGFAFDPNIKLGPGASSTAHYFSSPSQIVPYTVMCENDTTATLPAQIITIIDTLDKTKFDMASFGFTFVNLNDKTVTFLNAPSSFIQDIDLRSTTGYIARIIGSIDTTKGIVRWVVNTLDPTTLQITENPAAGILPPNFNKPEGEGSFGFIINKKEGLPDSTTISNKATIIFDFNKPILTPVWTAIIDETPPISEISPLAPVQSDTAFTIEWAGSDNLSGIESYNIYVAQNSGDYQLWKQFDALTDSVQYQGWYGNSYAFYSIAIDSAGNRELAPLVPDAVTSIPGITDVEKVSRNNSWLGQNRPNPFSNTTEIAFYLDKSYEKVDLVISDVTGRTIKITSLGNLGAGQHTETLRLDGIPPGFYSYKLNLNNDISLTKRMILLK